MLYAVLVIAAIACAIQAIRSPRLLVSALWLAGVSALVAIIFYLMGAHEVAVIELSVGAGLVTVLFVFAISVAGDDLARASPAVPWSLALVLAGLAALALIWLLRGALPAPAESGSAAQASASFTATLWSDRALDVLMQVVLIFTGVMGVLGLLADHAAASRAHGRPMPSSSFIEAVPAPARPRAAIAAEPAEGERP